MISIFFTISVPARVTSEPSGFFRRFPLASSTGTWIGVSTNCELFDCEPPQQNCAGSPRSPSSPGIVSLRLSVSFSQISTLLPLALTPPVTAVAGLSIGGSASAAELPKVDIKSAKSKNFVGVPRRTLSALHPALGKSMANSPSNYYPTFGRCSGDDRYRTGISFGRLRNFTGPSGCILVHGTYRGLTPTTDGWIDWSHR